MIRCSEQFGAPLQTWIVPIMQIQWFPGHMHKARKAMAAALPRVDLLIELLDARIPFSSENPMLAEIRGDKPCVKVLNKSDLADQELTKVWQLNMEQDQGVKSLALNNKNPEHYRSIIDLCKKLAPARAKPGKPLRAMVIGIPNVGKSTIINHLAGRIIAKTGNEPAVTKMQQRIDLGNGVILLDTPGVLWPNLENKHSGYRLAACAAIKDTAIDHTDLAFYLVDYLRLNYSKVFAKRYEMDAIPEISLEILEAIGKRRGCLLSGGMINLDQVAKIILAEFRAGMLGRITLETPALKLRELAELEIIRQQKREKKTSRKQRWKADQKTPG